MTELRKMTMGEVAEIAGDPKETIRARINRGVHVQKKVPGWARFDVPATMQIAIHAEMTRRIGVDEICMEVANFVADSLANFCNLPPYELRRVGQLAENYLLFRRHESGLWTHFWCRDQSHALRTIGEYIGESALSEAAGFYFLNVGTVTDWAMDRIFDLQGISENVATVPR